MVIKTLPIPSTKEPLVPSFDSAKRLLHSQSGEEKQNDSTFEH